MLLGKLIEYYIRKISMEKYTEIPDYYLVSLITYLTFPKPALDHYTDRETGSLTQC